MLAPNTFPVRVIGAASRRLLGSVDAICVLGRDMAALIARRCGRTPVHLTPNWASDDVLDSAETTPNPLRASLGLTDRFVVQYAGNLGGVQDIGSIVKTAAVLQARAPRIHFLFIGSGRKKRWLAGEVTRLALRNVTVLDELPRSEQAVFLRACDVALMSFVSGMRGVGVPSRLYNILASGRPVIAAVDPTSEPALVIQEEHVGWVIPPGDVDAMARAIMEAEHSADILGQMGRRAASAARSKYRREHILPTYVAILEGFGLPRTAPVRPASPELERANVL
jgi:glycosyltransferase involved in cell wall biosynthesis